ncbi:MAG TPA: serine/threonine-protein kinase, partial [Burkholderiales bacterium]|nr:serine/threonine-protein kinase [Burkholderiales bacterium]
MHDTNTAARTDISLDGLSLQVGKYEIQTNLGKGATGTVYLAKDPFTGRQVALKTIEPEVFRDPEFGAVYRQQFQNEASLAGKIRHPHIVAVYDAMVGEDSGYIAMEVVSGGDLSQYAKANALLPPADVLQIGFKCCGALDYAYRDQGIVHRDIKPANIMVTKDGDVKIADFGSAFLRRSKGTQTTAMGSPFYMAPEQIEGKELTFHSDMYSLGVVLYELLTGKRPFSANSIEALVQQILFEEPTPPSRLRPGLRPEIDQVVLRAMRKRPDQRYGTWAQFSVELSKAV